MGSIYHGFARSAGLDYWEALLYDNAGSLLWETAGENSPPSYNDMIASGIAGSYFGEVLFRMASLVLEGDGRQTRVLARAGRGNDFAIHGLQSPCLRRPVQARVSEP